MTNLTIIIPVYIDNKIRLNNFCYVINRLLKHDYIVMIAEYGPEAIATKQEFLSNYPGLIMKYYSAEDIKKPFHKTKLINEAVKLIDTSFFAMHDADVIFDMEDFKRCAELVINGKYDISLPFNGIFINIKKFDYDPDSDLFIAKQRMFKNYEFQILHEDSPGGSFITSVNVFEEIGKMNERIIGWGFDDDELLERYRILYYSLFRGNQECYHLDHPRLENTSSHLHQFYNNNMNEFLKVSGMDKQDLEKYIKSKNWNSLKKNIH